MDNGITGKKIARGIFWRLAEKVSAQLVSAIVAIVLARLLSPEDYGGIAIITIFISIAEIFVTSGISTSLIQKRNITEEEVSTIFYVGFILSVLLYILLFVTAPFISKVYKYSELSILIRVFSLKLPIAAFNSVQNALISRKMEFKKFFIATLLGTVVSGVLGIFLAFEGYGVWALVIQYLSNSMIDTIVLFITVGWYPKLYFSYEKAKPLIRFGTHILLTDLIGQMFNQLNSFIIGYKFSAGDLGLYTQGKKYPDLIDGTLSGTLNAVLFPAMAQQEDINSIIRIRRNGMKMLEYVLFPLLFGLFAVSDNFVSVVLTDKWIQSVFFMRVSCIFSLIGILGVTSVQEIKAIGRSDVSLRLELIKKPIFLIVTLVSIKFGLKAIALSLIVNQILSLVINIIPVKKYIGFNVKDHLFDLLPSLLMSLIMVMGVFFINIVPLSSTLILIIQIFVGIMTYVGLSIITQNECFYQILNIIKKNNKGT